MKQIKKLVVPVSQENIDWGIEGNSRRCMIKKAVEEKFPELKHIRVTRDYVRATDPERDVIYTFPMSAFGRSMLLLFDEGNRVALKPFALHLRRPIIRKRLKMPGSATNKKQIVGRTYSTTKSTEGAAKKHLGAVPASHLKAERDRVFGAKVWTVELQKLRLGIPLRGDYLKGQLSVVAASTRTFAAST
jgi:hypothetical protein